MTKESSILPEPHTSQDYDRKHGVDHIDKNPRATKDIPGPNDSMAKPIFTEDRRKTVRQEHTNHFTNRAPVDSK